MVPAYGFCIGQVAAKVVWCHQVDPVVPLGWSCLLVMLKSGYVNGRAETSDFRCDDDSKNSATRTSEGTEATSPEGNVFSVHERV